MTVIQCPRCFKWNSVYIKQKGITTLDPYYCVACKEFFHDNDICINCGGLVDWEGQDVNEPGTCGKCLAEMW